MGNVVISPNLKKEKAFINPNGDIIDPRTKQIITFNNDNTPEPAPQSPTMPQEAPVEQKVISGSPMEIQAQIEQKEKELEALKELKRQKIAEMKKQLEMLEA